MKKVKIIMSAAAVVISLGAAFVSRPQQDCLLVPRYYYNGAGYIAAGIFGKDYICLNSTSTCTYYGGNGTYLPCQPGSYMSLHAQSASAK